MYAQIDSVAVPKVLWDRVVAGDQRAIDELRKMLSGLVLYEHVLCETPDEIEVPLRQISDYVGGMVVKISFEG